MLRLLLLLALLLPAAAAADDGVPAPDAEEDEPSENDVPSPDGESKPKAPLPSAEGGVPGPDGPTGPFPADPGSTPSPDGAPGAPDVPSPDGSSEGSEPFAADPGDAPPPEAPSEPFPAESGDAPPPNEPSEPFPAEPGAAPDAATQATEEPAIEVSPLARPSDELYEAGQTLFGQLEFDAAIPYFEEVLRRDPDHTGARNFLVESLTALERTDEAVAIREGAQPAGEPTAVAGEEPEEQKSRNPRGDRKFSAGVGLGGAGVGLSGWAEFRPHWLVAISGGFGAVVLVEQSRATGVGAIHLGVDAAPVPWHVSPVVGVGVSAAFGDAVWRADAYLKPLVSGPDVRLVPYVNVGVRLDIGRMQLLGGVWLAPTGHRDWPILPIPGARLGLHF